MKKCILLFCFRFLPLLAMTAFIGCGKASLPDVNIPGEQDGSPFASVATFKKISLPTVDLANLIIPDLAEIHVTNMGPYIKIQDSNKMLWSVYKYHGPGSITWSSFTPDFPIMDFIPTSFAHEEDREFSIMWCGTVSDRERYGMYNLNNGSPIFEDDVPDGENGTAGPGRFSKIIPGKTSHPVKWGISGNEIWYQTATPTVFDNICEIDDGDGEFVSRVFADPDDGTTLWCSTQTRLYKVSAVAINPGGKGGIKSRWDFSPASSSQYDHIMAIMKVGDAVVIQFGDKIARQNDSKFTVIGTLPYANTASSNICTNGSTIFTSDGRYLNNATGEWQSYLQEGGKLSKADEAKFAELNAYLQVPMPVGIKWGSVHGPLYFLTPTDLLEVYPVF